MAPQADFFIILIQARITVTKSLCKKENILHIPMGKLHNLEENKKHECHEINQWICLDFGQKGLIKPLTH